MDTTHQGRYVYPPEAISPSCGSALLEVYSEKDRDTPLSKTIDSATIERVWADLEPYRKAQKRVELERLPDEGALAERLRS